MSLSKDNAELRDLLIQGFAQVNGRFDRVEARLGNVEIRLENVEARLGAVETRLGNVETRLEALEARVGTMETRTGGLEIEVRRHGEILAELRGELRGLAAWLSSMDSRFMAIMRPCEPPRRPDAAE